MKKIAIAMCAVGGIALIVFVIWIISPPFIFPDLDSSEPESSVSELPITFEPITFIGSDSKTTSPFQVTSQEWLIEWSYIPNYEYIEYVAFSFFIYPRGETVDFVEMVFLSQNTWGTTYSYAGPGEYYLKVDCANIESWQVIIKPA